MCSPAELVTLRKELEQLRGHYKDIGKTLGTLQDMESAAQELGERLQTMSRAAAQQGGAYSKGRSTAAGVLVDPDTHNGFDVVVSTLKFSRYHDDMESVWAKQMATVEAFVSELAAWSEERGTPFCDPTPVPLLPPPAQLRGGLRVSSDVMAKWRERVTVAAARDRDRREDVEPVLARIQIWRRLTRTLPVPVIFARGNDLLGPRPYGEIEAADAVRTLPKFEQGLLSDAWFQLALALVATRRNALCQLFLSAEHRDHGLYVFQFYASSRTDYPLLDPGEEDGWRCVIVDDLLPCTPAVTRGDGRIEYWPADGSDEHRRQGSPKHRDTLPMFGLTDQKGEMWSALLQKAYAKFLGGYSRLHRGDCAQALIHLTGGQTRVVQWDPESVDTATLAVLWWQLQEGARLRLLQACQMAPEKDSVASGRTGVVRRPEHMYLEWGGGDAIVTTCEISSAQLRDWGVDPRARSGARLVKLRNLRGTDEWDGDWSHTSPLWKPAARAHVNYGSMDEYVTWMNVGDFARQYNTLLICSEYHSGPSSFSGELPESSAQSMRRHGQQYLLTVAPGPDEEGSDRLRVMLFCSQPDRESSADEFSPRNRGTAQTQAHELEVRLFRAGSLVQPTVARAADEERLADWRFGASECDAAAEQRPAVFEWPEVGEVELELSGEDGNSFVLKRTCELPPGQYVAVVCQQGADWKFEVPYFLAVWSMEDESGPTSSPFLSPQRDRPGGGSPARGASRPRSGFSLKVEALGSAAEPRQSEPTCCGSEHTALSTCA